MMVEREHVGLFELAKPRLRKSEAAILRLDLLGATSLHMLDGSVITPTGAKTRGLLAILALSDRRPVTRRTLAGLLWSRRSDEQARASLRQEIHRLAEALSPLGADIVDVQRHTLALKPVLTTVDAERYLNATPSGILKLPETDCTLLTDLDGVDMALDEWLTAQRSRLQQHVITTLEQALLSLPDSSQRLEAAGRLLRLDLINETAWKTQIRELARKQDTSAALITAEQCLAAFRSALDAEPGPSTMAVISELRKQVASGKSATDISSVFAAGPDDQPRTDTGPRESIASAPGAFGRKSLLAGHIASVGFRPTVISPKVAISSEQITSLFDFLTTELAQFGFLSVVSPEASTAETESTPQQEKQTDCHIETRLQPGSGTHPGMTRLVVRVTDVRLGNIIIWADQFHVTTSSIETIAGLLTSEIAWRIALTEARNTMGRAARDLLPTEGGLRALALISRNDPDSAAQISELLTHALKRSPGHPFLLFVTIIFHMVRSAELWVPDRYNEALTEAVTAARQLIQTAPESVTGRLFLARLLLALPAEQQKGLALLHELQATVPTDGMISAITAYADLVTGKAQAAGKALGQCLRAHPTHPCIDLFDTDFMLMLLLTGHAGAALSRSRISLSTTPTRTAMLVLALATLQALEEDGDQSVCEEKQSVNEQIRKLAPGLTTEQVLGHYGHLPAAQQKVLYGLLVRGGLPEDAASA